MRISDWSSDVCSSDLQRRKDAKTRRKEKLDSRVRGNDNEIGAAGLLHRHPHNTPASPLAHQRQRLDRPRLVRIVGAELDHLIAIRSEEHTSELQSLMRISYAVFCLKKKTENNTNKSHCIHTNHIIIN